MKTIAISTCFLFVLGCQSRDAIPDWPPFSMSVPDSIPEEWEVFDKDGTKHLVKGKEVYGAFYKGGWKECIKDYQKQKLDLSKEPEEFIFQGRFYEVDAWNDGYRHCWQALRDSSK